MDTQEVVLSQEKLIARIVDRDQEAFADLYRSMLGQVYHLAYRITRSEQLAEEATEDTFWQVWRQAPRFEPARGSVLTWVMTIARSRALDALRQLDPAQCRDDIESLADQAIHKDNPPDLLSAVEESNCLHAALAMLDPVPRQLVALSFFYNLSHEEIASYADLPLGTVKSHIRRSLILLRKTMAANAPTNLGNA
jgi:RNA polymerase sigma factor (sigma-70 family)